MSDSNFEQPERSARRRHGRRHRGTRDASGALGAPEQPERPDEPKQSTRPKRSTYERALDMLEARSRGVAELRRLLIRKGEPADDVDAAIVRLRESGVLDDANFARQLTRSKALGAGHARRRIQQELSKRGVAREISNDAIAAVFDDEGVDEGALIERVARKKLRMLAKVDGPTRERRLYAFLARRGYDGVAIQRVLGLVLSDSTDGNDGSEENDEMLDVDSTE